MLLSEIPQIYFDADYLPAILLFKDRNYPLVIKVNGFNWYLNNDTNFAYYEKHKELT